MNHQIIHRGASPPTPHHYDASHRASSGSSHSLLHDITHDAHFGQDIDFVVGVTATALAADQLLKFKGSKNKDHKKAHLAKAGLSVAAAATAFTMMRREQQHDKKQRRRSETHRDHHRGFDHDTESEDEGGRSRPRPRSRPRSPHGQEDWHGYDHHYRRHTHFVTSSPRRSAPNFSHTHAPLPYPDDDVDDRDTKSAGQQRGRRARSLSPPANHH